MMMSKIENQPPTSLALGDLVSVKRRGNKVIAQCPACAAHGGDKSAEHLVIYDNGQGRWGCVAHMGDKEHRRQIAALVGRSQQIRPSLSRPIDRPYVTLPPLRIPSIADLEQVAKIRGFSFLAGLELAVRAGQLRCAELLDAGTSVPAWILLDSSLRCAQARRLDGQPWRFGNKTAKAKTLPGSQAAWPIGASDIGDKPNVALCEGGPDFLAAWSLAWHEGAARNVAPVFMAGSHSIHPQALQLFTGKGVWVFPHRDDAGRQARERWEKQLRSAGAKWVVSHDLAPHKDLNDYFVAVSRSFGDTE